MCIVALLQEIRIALPPIKVKTRKQASFKASQVSNGPETEYQVYLNQFSNQSPVLTLFC